jgi:hypothetical protein
MDLPWFVSFFTMIVCSATIIHRHGKKGIFEGLPPLAGWLWVEVSGIMAHSGKIFDQSEKRTLNFRSRVMNIDIVKLRNLITKRGDEIDRSVTGTGYLAKTVIGVGTFLLDNEGDVDLLSAKQKVIFDKFIQPLLAAHRR